MIFSAPLFSYALTAVKRDRVIQLMLVMMLLAAAVSIFLGGAATSEQGQYTVALAGTALRLVAVMGLVVFISFFMRRVFDSREIDYLLATPLTRTSFLFSLTCSFVCVALLLSVAIGAVMLGLSMKVSSGLLVWSASVAVELIITSMIALFFSCVLKSATISALSSFGYYTLARMMGMMIGIVQAQLIDRTWYIKITEKVVNVISVVVPRFDLLAQSAWVVYGKNTTLELWILPVQALVFCLLFFVCALSDLRRSQF